MIGNSLRMSRRRFSRSVVAAGVMTAVPGIGSLSTVATAAQDDVAESLVIDLDGELESIHPSLAYSARDWSVVHAVYDSIVYIDAAGDIVPLAAESFTTDDALSFDVVLKSGITFHDGTPVTAEVLRGSWEFLMNSGSSVTDVFTVITDVDVKDELSATIVCDSPSPWLPAQIATWLVLVPPGYTEEQALAQPVGTGPYKLASYATGEDIELARHADYQFSDVKGHAIAETATFRIVPDAATRVADVATGTANIASNIPQDFREEVESQGATVLDDPLVGSQWVRIATDVTPFDDPRVRMAMNHAVDTATIAGALLGPEVQALASIFPDERAPGFLASLKPYAYDRDRARSLLDEAGVSEGLEVSIEMTQSARPDIAEAIAANLEEVGFVVTVVTSDLATFNAGWADPEKPVLRLATWSPLYEPHTLLDLVFTSDGFLSRYSNQEVDELIDQSSVEPDPERRRTILESVNQAMYEDPPAIFLWNLTATYGVDNIGNSWSPRGNERIVPTSGNDD